MMVSHEKDQDMHLDAHKSAVARAYGLASAGYNKPALKFSLRVQRPWSILRVLHVVKRSWMLLLAPVTLRYTQG